MTTIIVFDAAMRCIRRRQEWGELFNGLVVEVEPVCRGETFLLREILILSPDDLAGCKQNNEIAAYYGGLNLYNAQIRPDFILEIEYGDPESTRGRRCVGRYCWQVGGQLYASHFLRGRWRGELVAVADGADWPSAGSTA